MAHMQLQQLHKLDHAMPIGRLALLPFEIRQHIFWLVLQDSSLESPAKPGWRFLPFSASWRRNPTSLPEDLDLAMIASNAEGFLPSIFEPSSYRVEYR